jgi:molybdate transport system substrate-binding protein
MKKSLILTLCMFLLVLSGCQSKQTESNEPETLTVSAAASLKDSVLDLKKQLEKDYPDIQVTFNFGSTGALRRQIEQGAPIDVFLSASRDDYEELVHKELIARNEGNAFLTNELVVISQKKAKLNSIEDLLSTNKKVAIGTPDVVPAGTYAKEALENMEVWDALQQQFIFAKDVRHVLTLVEEGAVEAGIVYKSDLSSAGDSVKILQEINPANHSKIEYYASIISTSKHSKEAEIFYDYITSPSNQSIFENYGFTSSN